MLTAPMKLPAKLVLLLSPPTVSVAAPDVIEPALLETTTRYAPASSAVMAANGQYGARLAGLRGRRTVSNPRLIRKRLLSPST